MVRFPAFAAALPETGAPARARAARGLRRWAGALAGAIMVGSLAAPAVAAPEARTKLVRCGEQSCLQISGHRDDPSAAIRINGRTVAVEGARGWQVRLPVETVRRWSAPHARTIEVSLGEPDAAQEASARVPLPIGMLGNVTSLASLEVTVR